MCSGLECWGDVYPVWSPECGWRRFLQSRRVHLVVWRRCHRLRSRRCAVVRGCAGNGHSPGETQDARKVDSSPGERCAEEPGYIWPVLVTGPPVYAWVVTGSLLFGSPPRRVQGCLRPPLLCQLRFDVPAVFRCVCVINTLTKSRLS